MLRLLILKMFSFSLLVLLLDHKKISKNELLLQCVELEGCS